MNISLETWNRIFLCLLIGMIPNWANAQVPNPTYTHYTSEDGLSSQTVHACFQDSKGYMWFGTNAGVSRFDGKEFTRLTTADGLCDDDVRGFGEDEQGRLWMLTRSNCLSFYQNDSIYSSEQFPGLDVECENQFSSMFLEANNNIYVRGLGPQVIRIDSTLHATTSYLGDIYNEVAPVSLYFMFDYPGLANNPRVSQEQWCEDGGQILSPIFLSSNVGGESCVLSSAGIYVIHYDSEIVELNESVIPDCMDMHRSFATRSHIWLTSRTAGVHCWNRSDLDAQPLTLFRNSHILQVFEDRDLNLWFCTETRGVFLIPRSQRNISTYRAATNDQVLSLASDKNGNIVAGTSTGLVIIFSERNLRTQFKIAQVHGTNGISEILVDSHWGDLWCGGDFGLLHFKNLGQQWFPLPETKATGEVHGISETIYGDVIFALSDSVAQINLGDQFLRPVIRTSSSNVQGLYGDPRGWYWEFTDNHLRCARDVKWAEIDVGTNRISSLAHVEDEVTAVSTFGNGIVYLVDSSEAYFHNIQTGLLSNRCKQIRVEHDVHYVASDKGVDIYRFRDGQIEPIRSITARDGLPSEDIHDVLVRDQMLYLGTSRGLVIMELGQEDFGSSPPLLDWQTVTVSGNVVDHSKALEIDHDELNVNLTFNALNFDHGDATRGQYRLHADGDWQDFEGHSLDFPSLEPNEYDLQVRVKKQRSDWSEPINLSLSVLPPFYGTWWFRILLILGIAGIFILVYRFYAQRKYERKLAIIRQEQAILEERDRISADMHDELGSELTNIVLLSRIAGSQLNLQGEEAQPIQRIDSAASGVISKMNEIIWALNPANDSLEGLSNYLQRYLNEYLELHDLGGRMERPSSLAVIPLKAVIRRNLFLIVKEFLQNTQKYAQATRVSLLLDYSDQILKIRIEDNGVGFDLENRAKAGNGLRNMKKRAESIGGKAKIRSAEGEGTSIEVEVIV